jgi:2-methylcitrate dehydratase
VTDRIAELLARYATSVSWTELPHETVHEVKRRVLDSIGAAVAGFEEDAPTAARAYVGGHPAPRGAGVWGAAQRADAERAGFANAVAVRALDFNDTYLSREPLHPSDAIPALAALAEERRLGGRELIRSIAIAYEVGVTLCDAASLRTHGWDHVNFLGIGVACGAGALLHLPTQAVEHAISITAVAHAAMRQTRAGELSMWKGAAAAEAARGAVTGVLLAEAGMTGPNEPFEGEMGFRRQLLRDDWLDDDVLWRLQDGVPPTRILDTSIKYWPVEYHAQSAVDAALSFPEDVVREIDRIRSIKIDTFDAAYQIIAKDPEKWDPKTRETADHSIQYIVVAALMDGEITRRSFDLERIRDPKTLDVLKNRVEVHEDLELTAEYPEATPNRITVTTETGDRRVREVRHPRGHARNPMTDEEVVAKYKANVAERWDHERTAWVQHLVWDLEREGNLEDLFHALAEPSEPR